jgi:hypothetical protein
MASEPLHHLVGQLEALERPSQRQIQSIVQLILDQNIILAGWARLLHSIRSAPTPDVALARLFALDALLSSNAFVAPCESDAVHAELEAILYHFAVLCASSQGSRTQTEAWTTQVAKLDDKWVRRRLLKYSTTCTPHNSIVGERTWIQSLLRDLDESKHGNARW